MTERLKRFGELVLRSEMIKNTTLLVSGTALAQLIPIALQPVLRRIYPDPELFGAYSVYVSIAGILLVASSLRFELAIVLPKKDSESQNVLFLSAIISLAFNFLLLLIILVLQPYLLEFLNFPGRYSFYIFLIPLGTFLLSVYQLFNYWLVRKKRFFAISINKFVRRGFEGASQVSLKYITGFHGLITGDIIGHFSNIVSGIYQSGKCGLTVRLFSIRKIKEILITYSEYPKFNLIPSLMSACSYLLPAIIISRSFSPENAGYYDLSKLLLSVPLALIATSLSNVLLQRITEKHNLRTSIKRDILYVLVFVSLVAIIEVLVIIIWAEDIFSVFFGDTWMFSGTISKTLVWAFAANFIVSSLSSIYISLKRIKLLSFWQLVYFCGIISLFYFTFSDFNLFLKTYVTIEVGCSFLSLLIMGYIIIKYERSTLKKNYSA